MDGNAEKDWVILEIEKRGLVFHDKRSKGGGLWIVGGREITEDIEMLRSLGAKFTFKLGGGRTTGYRDGWWLTGYPKQEGGCTSSHYPVERGQSEGQKIAEITRAILRLLSEVNEPCTYGFVGFELPQYEFDDIEDVIELLKMQKIVSENSEGISLVVTEPSEVDRDSAAVKETRCRASEIKPDENEYVNSDVVAELSWNSRLRRDDLITKIDVSPRVQNALASAGFSTVEEVVGFLHGARAVRGLGESGIQEIRNYLQEAALSLVGPERKVYEGEEFVFDSFGFLCRKDDELSFEHSELSEDVSAAIKNAFLFLKRKKYPVYKDRFCQAWGLRLQELAKEKRTTPVLELENLISEIEASEILRRSCEADLIRQIREEAVGLMDRKPAEQVRVPVGAAWISAAKEVCRQRRWCSFDQKTRRITFRYPRITAWANSLEPTAKLVVRSRLLGKPFEECGTAAGITASQAQGIFQSHMKARPLFFEDRYCHLMENYVLDRSAFCNATGEGNRVFNYLTMYACKDAVPTKPIVQAVMDRNLDESIKTGIAGLNDLGYISVEGADIHVDLRSIISHVVKTCASDRYISLARLIDEYRSFIDKHCSGDKIESLQIESPRAFSKIVQSLDDVLFVTRASTNENIRYYDPSGKRFSQLSRLLTEGKHKSMVCSLAVVTNDSANAEIMQAFDIRDEYELHAVLKKYCRSVKAYSLGRSPMVTIGKADRDRQILELIKEMSPATSTALAEEYERRYGVKKQTFLMGYLKGFEAYQRNGKYIYTDERMSADHRKFLKAQLTEDYHALSLVRARFHDEFPGSSTMLINDNNLKSLGYHVSCSLIVRCGIDVRRCFGDLIDSHPSFSAEDADFGLDVFDHPAFESELQKKIRSLDYIEYDSGCYASTKMLLGSSSVSLRKADIRGYFDAVIKATEPRRPFTVFSLRKSGFKHRLDRLRLELGISDVMYESVLKTLKTNTDIKSSPIGNTTIFNRCPGAYRAYDFIGDLVGERGYVEVDDLLDSLSDDYGIEMKEHSLRMLLERADVYFVPSLDMAFDSAETFKRVAREVIGE